MDIKPDYILNSLKSWWGCTCIASGAVSTGGTDEQVSQDGQKTKLN